MRLSPSVRLELNKARKFAEPLAKNAGRILKKGFSARKSTTHKGVINLVTQFDLASEKLIVGEIKKKFPEHDLLAEEGSSVERKRPFRWVIDPLDGTTNFAHGFPIFCVSIALQYNGATVLGVIYDPLRDEIFFAEHKRGATLNGSKISVTKEKDLTKALCVTGFPYDMHTSARDNLANFRRVIKISRDVRRIGSAALDLCYVACGRFDVFWELKLLPWDVAAGALIAHEAGASVSDFSGGEFLITGKEILVTNGRLHKEMIKLVC